MYETQIEGKSARGGGVPCWCGQDRYRSGVGGGVAVAVLRLLRGTTLNRTYGTHKNLFKSLFLLQKCLVLFAMAPRSSDKC